MATGRRRPHGDTGRRRSGGTGSFTQLIEAHNSEISSASTQGTPLPRWIVEEAGNPGDPFLGRLVLGGLSPIVQAGSRKALNAGLGRATVVRPAVQHLGPGAVSKLSEVAGQEDLTGFLRRWVRSVDWKPLNNVRPYRLLWMDTNPDAAELYPSLYVDFGAEPRPQSLSEQLRDQALAVRRAAGAKMDDTYSCVAEVLSFPPLEATDDNQERMHRLVGDTTAQVRQLPTLSLGDLGLHGAIA